MFCPLRTFYCAIVFMINSLASVLLSELSSRSHSSTDTDKVWIKRLPPFRDCCTPGSKSHLDCKCDSSHTSTNTYNPLEEDRDLSFPAFFYGRKYLFHCDFDVGWFCKKAVQGHNISKDGLIVMENYSSTPITSLATALAVLRHSWYASYSATYSAALFSGTA